MMTAYERLQAARAQDRPTSRAYIENLFTERTELHGDRKYADDPAIIGGIGYLGDIPVTFIGIERGRDLQERIRCNFGCPMPEGYRKRCALCNRRRNSIVLSFVSWIPPVHTAGKKRKNVVRVRPLLTTSCR